MSVDFPKDKATTTSREDGASLRQSHPVQFLDLVDILAALDDLGPVRCPPECDCHFCLASPSR